MIEWKNSGCGCGCICSYLRGKHSERRHFRVTHYDLDTPRLEADAGEETIVFLSDLHNTDYGPKMNVC